MYTTQHPDEDCANLIVQSGIKEVKYMRNDKRGHRDFEENADRIFTLGRVSNMYVHKALLCVHDYILSIVQ